MKNIIRNRDIIVVGIQPWDIEIGSNCKNIALEFSRHNRVLYVNSTLNWITALREKDDPRVVLRKKVLAGKEVDLVLLSENLWNLNPRTKLQSINQIGNNSLFDFFNKRNNTKFVEQIKSAINRLNFKDYIIFNDSDMIRSFYLKELLKPKTYVYYTRDNLLAISYWQKRGTRIEPLLMKKSDLVVANSPYLAMLAGKHNPKSYNVGQGCDVSQFDATIEHELPEDIKPIKRPIIGYIGALLKLRLDINVLIYIAEFHPDWSLILVGPEDEHFKTSKLHQIKNVYFLGNKTPEQLPAYIKAFDVPLNPQIVSPLTVGNYPRKIDEYLAMGKPVVATQTVAMEYFADWVYLGETKEDYLELIEKALQEDSPKLAANRREYALTHSWENNVKEIWDALDKVKGKW